MHIEDLAALPLTGLQAAYRDRSLSPVEVVDRMLAQAEAVNGTLNALYGLRFDDARAEAAAAEARFAKGQPAGPFDGIPVTIKDSIHAVGMMWHHGSRIHGDGAVGTFDAPPTRKLKAAKAIILGKGTMPDFGLSGSGVSGSHGIVRNPWGTAWNTGGSSAGGGASLAAGIGMMSVGSDIAGSVRLPASHCGLAALKPTQGVIAHSPASTVRSAGPMTRRAADLLAWTRLLSGIDPQDRYSLPLMGDTPVGAWMSDLAIGLSTDFGFGPDVEPDVLSCVAHAATVLATMAPRLAEIARPFDFDAYQPIDDSLKLRGWLEYSVADRELRSATPRELFTWFEEARDWSPERVRAFETGIEAVVSGCVAMMDGLDFLITPVMPIVNFPAEQRGIDPGMPLRHTTFSAPFNQSGNPAVTICGGFDRRGLPIGIQIIGHRMDDVRLLALATALEQKLGVHDAPEARWPITPKR